MNGAMSKDRPKSTWIKAIKNDKIVVILTEDDLSRAEWRKRVHVAIQKYFGIKDLLLLFLLLLLLLFYCTENCSFLHIKLSFSFIVKDKADVGRSGKEE